MSLELALELHDPPSPPRDCSPFATSNGNPEEPEGGRGYGTPQPRLSGGIVVQDRGYGVP